MSHRKMTSTSANSLHVYNNDTCPSCLIIKMLKNRKHYSKQAKVEKKYYESVKKTNVSFQNVFGISVIFRPPPPLFISF